MRSLENQLGARLLHRTTRSVSLTEEGERLLARLVPLLGELDAVLDEIGAAHGQLGGSLRINAPEGAIRWLLRHVVTRYRELHPAVELDLVAEGQFIDIVAAGFDAGVRLGEAVPRDMVAVPLNDAMRFVAVASPGYLARHGVPSTPDDLRQHECIRQRLPSGKRYRWEFSRNGQEMVVDVAGALTLDNIQLMVEASIDGLGIAFVPETYVREIVDAGQLTLVLSEWSPPIAGLQLYFPGARHVPPNLRALIDLIRVVRKEATL